MTVSLTLLIRLREAENQRASPFQLFCCRSRVCCEEMLQRLILGFIAALGVSHAVPLRVVTFNLEALRDINGSPTFALSSPGTADFETIESILARINADIVCLQELSNFDISGGTNGATNSDVHALANALGLEEVVIPTTSGVFDFQLRNAILSRYPVTDVTAIGTTDVQDELGLVGSNGERAREMTRAQIAAVVEIPGVAIPVTVVTVHSKSGTGSADRFRRAVEMARLENYLLTEGLDSNDAIVLAGDFNFSGNNISFTSEPSGLPNTWNLATDIALPITYQADPDFYFSAPIIFETAPVQQLNGNEGTFETGSQLDFILATAPLNYQGGEVYRSDFDISNTSGRPKVGNPVVAGASAIASDHYAVFADYELPGEQQLVVTLSQNEISEADDQIASLTISVVPPLEAGETIIATITSSDEAEAYPELTQLILTSTGPETTLIRTALDDLNDDGQEVSFLITADGFLNQEASLTVVDADETFYRITANESSISEEFDSFDGTTNPARWVISPQGWSGSFSLSESTSGNYEGNNRPILVPSTGGTTFSTFIRNDTDSALREISVELEGAILSDEVLRESPFSLTTSLNLPNAEPLIIPTLSFAEILPTNLPAQGLISDFELSPNETAILSFQLEPLDEVISPIRQAFVNELHYDNTGSDANEFIEVVVAPGLTDRLDEISLVLYNGANGEPYEIIDLEDFDNFSNPEISNGYQIFTISQSGIQNGPDGWALVIDDTVEELLSYEGSFAIVAGPAAGMTTTAIPVSQNSNNPLGTDSLGLNGVGSRREDFNWQEFSGQPFTPGLINISQDFEGFISLPQSLAFERVTIVLGNEDEDGDGLSDSEEALLGTNPALVDSDGDGINDDAEDFDGDGLNNFTELRITLTDPLDSSSRFEIELQEVTPSDFTVSIPTLEGRSYQLFGGEDLAELEILRTIVGSGNTELETFPRNRLRFFLQAEVSIP